MDPETKNSLFSEVGDVAIDTPNAKENAKNTKKTDETGKQDDDNAYYPDEELVEGEWTTPKVELTPIRIVTGEEEEEVIWKQKAKLYRYCKNSDTSGEWKERGYGDAKLLKHTGKKLIRFLLRQEKTHKIVANHYVLKRGSYCKLVPNVSSEKILVWSVQDYAEDEPKVEQFAIRFSTVEDAKHFVKCFDEAANHNDLVLDPKRSVKPEESSAYKVDDDGLNTIKAEEKKNLECSKNEGDAIAKNANEKEKGETAVDKVFD